MIMWKMILIAVNIYNPNDIPGRVELEFQNHQTCQQTLESIKWQLKFSSFKIVGICEQKQS
jgi:hypothetical protein